MPYILAFTISAIMQFVLIKVSKKMGLFIDKEDKVQQVHTGQISRNGGIGIFLALLLLPILSPYATIILLAFLPVFLIGLYEDLFDALSPTIRMVLLSLSAIYIGNYLDVYLIDTGFGLVPVWFGVAFTIFAVVGFVNAVNIIDGINGLSSGFSTIILIAFSYIAYSNNDIELFQTIVLAIFAILGFYVWNFPKGKIFLGDGGAYMLGGFIAIVALIIIKNEYMNPWGVLLLTSYPVIEVIFSIFRRKKAGLPAMYPDKNHMHHLIFYNFTNKSGYSAVWLYLIGLIPIIMVFATPNDPLVHLILLIVYSIIYIAIYKYVAKK